MPSRLRNVVLSLLLPIRASLTGSGPRGFTARVVASSPVCRQVCRHYCRRNTLREARWCGTPGDRTTASPWRESHTLQGWTGALDFVTIRDEEPTPGSRPLVPPVTRSSIERRSVPPTPPVPEAAAAHAGRAPTSGRHRRRHSGSLRRPTAKRSQRTRSTTQSRSRASSIAPGTSPPTVRQVGPASCRSKLWGGVLPGLCRASIVPPRPPGV